MREIDFEKLEVGQPVVTRDGREGEVVCFWNNGFVVRLFDGSDVIKCSKSGGCYYTNGNNDIFLPPKKEYLNLVINKE